jgi:hypothetical protein
MRTFIAIAFCLLFFACDYGKKEFYDYIIINSTVNDITLKSYNTSIDTFVLKKEVVLKANGGKFEALHISGKWADEPPLSPSSTQILSGDSVVLFTSNNTVKSFTIKELDKGHNILNLNHYEKKKKDKHEHSYTYTITQDDFKP